MPASRTVERRCGCAEELRLPLATLGERVAGRWQLYLRWADSQRERRTLGPTIDLPDGGRLYVHPEPGETTSPPIPIKPCCGCWPTNGRTWKPRSRRNSWKRPRRPTPNVFRRWPAKGVANALRRYGITTNTYAGRKVYGKVTLGELARIQAVYGLTLGLPEADENAEQ